MAKKKKKEDRFQALATSDLLKKIRQDHGASILKPADEFRIQQVHRIPSGVFFYDYALGGGYPAGKISIVWGHKSTGKTALCLRTLGNAQRICSNCYTFPDANGKCECKKFRETVCAFLDVEGSWDQEWAQLQGVDTSRVLLSVPEYAEQTLDIAEALLRSKSVDFMVIDSLAFLTPAKEIEESTKKALQAEQARVVGRGIRKFVAAFNWLGNRTGRRPTLLFTNQIRMKLGVMFGSPETQPAGYGPGFSATTETRTFGGTYEMDDVTGKPLWVDMSFRVEKNKSAGAKVEGEWRLMLADTEIKKKGDVYEEPGMIEMGKRVGLVEKEGNGWTCFGEKYRSQSKLAVALAEDAELKKKFGEMLASVLRT